MLPALLFLALQAGPALPGEGVPSPPPPGEGPVILFLVDNSASLPPLDPDEKRVAALEKMFTFLKGHRYRLILFGGKDEISVDDVSRYRNDGLWTDFYHAFLRAKQLADTYPRGVELRMILLTDANPDPDPKDWPDLPKGWDVRSYSIREAVKLVRAMGLPLYVVLVGDPGGEVSGRDREQSPGFVLDLVQAANGAAAAPLAQTIASFFHDDGLLLRKFVYRVSPHEGLKKIEPVVKRIASPPQAGIELRIFGYFVLPLLLILGGLLGLLVRSFPGPGDLEILELAADQPVHVAADRIHRAPDGTWSTQGLSLADDARTAAATFTLQGGGLELTGVGLETRGLDPRDAAYLPKDLDETRRALEAATDAGTREDKIHALNLDYAARGLDPQEAERILTRPLAERSRVSAVDFVRAKVHLAFDEPLRRRLLEPRVQVLTYGKAAARHELAAGAALRVGGYGFRVREIAPGGRKDARLALCYDHVPSLLGLKTLLPDAFQRALRFRRRRQRVVC
ncbi:MAG TPA: vWA domain-containing protein [Vicinamibacteria bacterium]|nr:vWA domain-containing protein [Vicinamibacteria bacterium]